MILIQMPLSEYQMCIRDRNKEVQKLKHDMKHKLHELYHLVENSDGQELSEKIGAMCKEFEQIDEKKYSDNPIVDSVLRIKFGRDVYKRQK